MANGEEASGLIRFDAVEIDGEGHRLRVDGVDVPLERKAFAVLLLLANHPGRVFAREEILDAVWGHAHITPGVLNRIVTLLRQALGESGESHRYLHTVHGVGYRFDRPVHTARVGEAPPGEPGVPSPAPVPVLREIAERLRGSRLLPAVLIAIALVVAGISWALWSRSKFAPAASLDASTPRSIAVLPLVDAGDSTGQPFFADGLSENLIAVLSQFEGLRVISRSSSFKFRDGKEDVKSIGAKLGVAHLIEGSVQRTGDDVRISIELVRTSDGSIVWTQRFDRPYQDLFAMQDEIALAVAGALQVRLLHSMPGAIESGRPRSGNLDAYNAFLHGAYYMSADRDSTRAIERYEEATRLDPGYAQAWSWLGFMRTQYGLGSKDRGVARAAWTEARRDIDTALRLEPGLGTAHATLANLLSAADHDWNGALAEFRKAIPLVPDTDPTHGAISRLLATLGKVNEAIDERRKYIAGDPLATFARIYLAQLLASVGRLDEAEASLRNVTEIDQNARDWLLGERTNIAVLRGHTEEATAEAKRMTPDRWRDRMLALALQTGNDRAAADAALQNLLDTDGQIKNDAYAIARVYALRGEADRAFEWLRRDRERGDTGVHQVLHDPLLLRFRDDARLAAYCAEAGLPPPQDSEALDIDAIRAAFGAKR